MRKPAVLLCLVVVIAVLSGAGYFLFWRGQNGDANCSDKVSVRMKWFFAGTMVPWFAGKEKGFYKDARIDLEIHPGGPDNNAVKLVAAGTDLFGVAGADEVLLAREKGIPVVAIAVLFKESPIC